MASPEHDQQAYSTVVAPPPTPSDRASNQSVAAAADAISQMLLRLPRSLSLPPRLHPASTQCPIIRSLAATHSILAVSQQGFFQIADQSIPLDLARAAESDAALLFNAHRSINLELHHQNWPLGFDEEDDGLGCDKRSKSFCLECSSSSSSSVLLPALAEFARTLEKVGMSVIESLFPALGLRTSVRKTSSLMWISKEPPVSTSTPSPGRPYPYVIALQYQIRADEKYSLLTDSGWVAVSPLPNSVLVTVGDIAHVWSNGKLNKVRGRPALAASGGACEDPGRALMSLLITLPLDSIVRPLFPAANGDEDEDDDASFCSFSFQDYAWRVYHEQLLLKDSLDRYRI